MKLIASDVDGTLLDSNHRLTPATVQALKKVQELGTIVTLATGRILPSVIEITAQLGLSAPLILANGALLQYPNGPIIRKCSVPKDIVETVIATSSRFDVDLACYTPGEIVVRELNYNTSLIIEYGEPTPREIKKWSRVDDVWSEICKLILVSRRSSTALAAIEAELRENLAGAAANIQRSVPFMLEITSSESTKSEALQLLVHHLGISLKEVMAIGDSFNDVDMFRVTGFSVAMGNAPEQIRRAAEVVIGTNDEDGVAKFLSRRLLDIY